MTRREQWALIGVVALIAAGLGVQAWHRIQPEAPVVYIPGQGRWEKVADFKAGDRPAPTPTPAKAGQPVRAAGEDRPTTSGGLDLNRATAEELDRLPGIGAAYAQAILELRARLGGFRTVDQIRDVSGIGPKSMERLRPYVKVEGAPTSVTTAAAPGISSSVTASAPSPSPSPSATPTPTPRSTPTPDAPVDINRAPAEELASIKGIGPVLAQRIVEDRQRRGPYRRAADLLRVPGIGPRSLTPMLPQILVGPAPR